jgi:hypothetical protein
VLSGSKKEQRALIRALGLPEISSTEYLAHKFSTDAERKLAAKYSCAT